MCFASIFLLIIQKAFKEKLMRWGFTMQSKEIVVDEDLPPFLTTISLKQAEEVVQEEMNMMFNYRIGLTDADTIAAMR